MKKDNRDEYEEMNRLLRENTELIKANNVLLRKMYRNDLIAFWVRVSWYALLIGLPFVAYFYFLEPYFKALGSDYQLFKQGILELPGLKGVVNLLPK